jgi:isopentenyl-diphosphate delta-isomerase
MTGSNRKDDHIALCRDGDAVAFRARTTLLDEVELIHDALPELAADEVDLRATFVGRTLRAPLVIAAMTGGTPQATAINRDLAAAAERHGLAFAFGSQRPLLTRGIRDGYDIREVAPTAPVLGNLGVVQARETTTAAVLAMLDDTGADALCVHLNPAMELVQPGGDVDFRGGLDTIRRLVEELGRPVIVKETGCGLSRRVAERLVAVGVTHVDVSGAGGTSWVGVEARRAAGAQATLGERFWDWGIPTAASVAALSDLPLTICATGGIHDGLDGARAIALGARVVGVARALLQAQARGPEALDDAIAGFVATLRVAHVLTGCRDGDALRRVSLVIGPALRRWIPAGHPLHARRLDS